MLEAMRNFSKHIVIKILLGVLAVSFAIWGVGDVFRGRSSNAIATVGDHQILYPEYANTLQREIRRYQQILGQSFTEEQIQRFDIKNIVLNQMVDSQLIRMRMEKMNVRVGNDAAKEQILANNAFADEQGKFSKEIFDRLLSANGINKDAYIESLKNETAVRLLVETLAAQPTSLVMQAKALYAFRNEQRFADLVTLPANANAAVAEPTDAEIKAYYDANPGQFTVPELRSASYMKLNLKDIAATVELDEARVQAEYDANPAGFEEPEKRDVDQYLFDSEAEAKAALAELKAGKVANHSAKKNALGEVAKDSLPAEVQESVFTLPVSTFGEPIKSELGWHIFMVNKVVPLRTKTFAEVKDSLTKEMKGNMEAERFYEMAGKIEDAITSGTAMEELAKQYGLTIAKVAQIDQSGNDATGKEVTDVPDKQTFVPLVFSTESGATSAMTMLPDNETYVTVRVDAVTPERVKPLEETKELAVNLWEADQREKNLEKRAQEIAKQIKAGGKAQELAAKNGAKFVAAKAVTRPEPSALPEEKDAVPTELANAIFTLKKGEVTDAYRNADGSFTIGQLTEIKPAEDNPGKLATLEDNLKREFSDDLVRQYYTYLRKEYPVSINETMLNATGTN